MDGRALMLPLASPFLLLVLPVAPGRQSEHLESADKRRRVKIQPAEGALPSTADTADATAVIAPAALVMICYGRGGCVGVQGLATVCGYVCLVAVNAI